MEHTVLDVECQVFARSLPGFHELFVPQHAGKIPSR